ncbi:MAG: hypothetical protein WBD40_08860, partial [Tepidisphaeraceae bacterium]
VRPVRHALEDQMSALQRAMKQPSNRVAVGGETISLDEAGRLLRGTAATRPDEDACDPFEQLSRALRSQPS